MEIPTSSFGVEKLDSFEKVLGSFKIVHSFFHLFFALCPNHHFSCLRRGYFYSMLIKYCQVGFESLA